jgi:hypothetical protein
MPEELSREIRKLKIRLREEECFMKKSPMRAQAVDKKR